MIVHVVLMIMNIIIVFVGNSPYAQSKIILIYQSIGQVRRMIIDQLLVM
jgi:hypothetical protein